MAEVTRAGFQKVASKLPRELHGRLERVAEASGRGTRAPSKSERGVESHQERVTLDDIPDGHAKFERCLRDAAQVRGRGGSISVGGGYRDTRFSRAFWGGDE